MKVLFVCPYPYGLAPSQRFRFEQYFPLLREKGINFSQASFFTPADYAILYKKGSTLRKAFAVLRGFFMRMLLLASVPFYDRIFIHREAAPVGPPVFEFIIAKIFRKPVIFDFDDAIWLPNTSPQNRLVSGLKWHSKTRNLIRWAAAVSCGNDYLCSYSRRFSRHVILNPTTINTIHQHNRLKDQFSGKLVIGWTGTHSTAVYLQELVPVIAELEKDHDFLFLVISNEDPGLPLRSFRFLPWNKESEINDLLRFNIGVMPLQEDSWSAGKCGFKILQYMALGIPPVASPVGVNTAIIDHEKNGLLASGIEEWEKSLKRLMQDASLRQKMGSEGRKKVEGSFSTASNSGNFLTLINNYNR